MITQNLLGMDFCQKQVSGIHFDIPWIEIKNPPKSICYGSFHQNKSYPHCNWQEVVKLIRDIFTYADVQIGVYTLE